MDDPGIRRAFEEYRRTGVLSAPLTLHAALEHERYQDRRPGDKPSLLPGEAKEIAQAMERLHAAAKVFEGARWFWGGLQEHVGRAPERYLTGQGEGWSMRTGCIAGRCLITLTDNATDQQVTLITGDDEQPFARQEWGSKSMGPMGIQSIEATEETALRLIRLATLTPLELHPADLAIG